MPEHVHFVGIGGIGMAGLARLFVQQGRVVTGSEASPSSLTDALAALGVGIQTGHRVSALPDRVDWAVRTPAVAEDNPEVTALRQRGVPVFARGEVLAAFTRERPTLAVAGAHGKTTTSAMLAWILHGCGRPCGYAIGGETALTGRVADQGSDPLFVCEADESDGTLVHYAPRVGVVTHVEWDHPERFVTPEAIYACYRYFMQRSERLWILADDADARRLAAGHPNLATVGRGAHCDMEWLERQDHPQGQQIRICLKGQEASGTIPLPGLHNTHNALMALGAAHDAGVGLAEGLAALADFASVGRRFEQFRHDGVIWLRDYAHHPTEIRALLESIRALKPRRILLGYQPHRYSRTQRLLPQFVRAFQGVDRLDLLPVYAASELPAQGVDSEVLAKACMRELDIPVTVWPNRETLRTHWQTMAQPGDVVAVVGAGDIGGLWEAARDSGDA